MPRIRQIDNAGPPIEDLDGVAVWPLTCDGLPPDHDCTEVLGTISFTPGNQPSVGAFNGYLCQTCAAERDTS